MGLLLGLVLMIGGLGRIAREVLRKRAGFGALQPEHVLRQAIPSVTSLTLGVEVVLSAFLLSILSIRKRRPHD